VNKLLLLIAVLPLLLLGCATVPTDPLPPTCPKGTNLPTLEKVPADVLELDFTDRMESFLSGNLPEPTSYELRSKAATGLTTRPPRN